MLVLRMAARASTDVCEKHWRGATPQSAHVVAADATYSRLQRRQVAAARVTRRWHVGQSADNNRLATDQYANVAAEIGSRQYTQGTVSTATGAGVMMVGSSSTRVIGLAAFRRQCTSGEGGTRSGRTQARRVFSVLHGYVRRGPDVFRAFDDVARGDCQRGTVNEPGCFAWTSDLRRREHSVHRFGLPRDH